MRFYIDKFMKLGGAFIIHGWCEAYEAGAQVTLTVNGSQIETVTRSVTRDDLPPHFGSKSEGWGFRAYGITDGPTETSVKAVGLAFANGATLSNISETNVPAADLAAHAIWSDFVRDVNEKGGRLLEIGSRARSGGTARAVFGPTIEYIGLDVTDGPNVDIVADAHHLSRHVSQNVDFVCSISTFEHFIMPWKVVLEANRILNVGGRIFSHSHQSWPEHDVPFDYFRFSEHAWSGVFNEHTGFRIVIARVGHPVAIASMFNVGGPFDEMEHSPGHAMSVCIAEKVAEPLVSWDAETSLITDVKYTY